MELLGLTAVMSVYHGDSPIFFKHAIDSVLNQSCKAQEFIIVVDGPVGDEINKILESVSKLSNLRIIRMSKNKGLAVSRKLAISEASTELVAVMDSDDICAENRFELQLEEFSNPKTQVIGGWIEEFNRSPGDQCIIRKTPLTLNEIYGFGKWRNPMNHVTLMFKKSAYEAVGGYSELKYTEDWELISRMLVGGVNVRNIPQVLVYVRGGDEMIIRRRKLSQIFGEIRVLWLMYKMKYLGHFHLLANIAIRITIRIFPKKFTDYLYTNVLRKDRKKILK